MFTEHDMALLASFLPINHEDIMGVIKGAVERGSQTQVDAEILHCLLENHKHIKGILHADGHSSKHNLPITYDAMPMVVDEIEEELDCALEYADDHKQGKPNRHQMARDRVRHAELLAGEIGDAAAKQAAMRRVAEVKAAVG